MFISVKMTIPFLYIFPYDQTSTSVLQFPIPVTRTLIAPTVTVPTAVLVKRGSLETGRLVKVLISVKCGRLWRFCKCWGSFWSVSSITVPFYISFFAIRHR